MDNVLAPIIAHLLCTVLSCLKDEQIALDQQHRWILQIGILVYGRGSQVTCDIESCTIRFLIRAMFNSIFDNLEPWTQQEVPHENVYNSIHLIIVKASPLGLSNSR